MKRKNLIKILGFYDNGTGKHQSNTVYSRKGAIPTLTTIEGGGTQQIKVLRRLKSDKTNNVGSVGQQRI